VNIRINTAANQKTPRLEGDSALAYAAGMFDGDGCVHIARQKKLTARRGYIFRLVANVSQNHLGTLIDFQDLVGVAGRIYQQTRKGTQNRDTYSLAYDGRSAAEMIRRISPYLLRKNDEVKVALHFQENCEIGRHFGPNGCPESIWNLREACYRKLRNLK